MIKRSVRTQMPAKVQVLPGMLLREVSRKHPNRRNESEVFVVPHDVKGGMATGRFALPNDDTDAPDRAAAYPVGSQVPTILAGDTELEVLLAADEIVFNGSPLVSNGDGYLCHWQSVPGAAKVLCYSAVDLDLSGLPSRLIQARTRLE